MFSFFSKIVHFMRQYGGKTEYIVTFPLPHWLGERVKMLRHTQIASLFTFNVLMHKRRFPRTHFFLSNLMNGTQKNLRN
jgi:hypothetical protein